MQNTVTKINSNRQKFLSFVEFTFTQTTLQKDNQHNETKHFYEMFTLFMCFTGLSCQDYFEKKIVSSVTPNITSASHHVASQGPGHWPGPGAAGESQNNDHVIDFRSRGQPHISHTRTPSPRHHVHNHRHICCQPTANATPRDAVSPHLASRARGGPSRTSQGQDHGTRKSRFKIKA